MKLNQNKVKLHTGHRATADIAVKLANKNTFSNHVHYLNVQISFKSAGAEITAIKRIEPRRT